MNLNVNRSICKTLLQKGWRVIGWRPLQYVLHKHRHLPVLLRLRIGTYSRS